MIDKNNIKDMVERFIIEKRISKRELARCLGVKVKTIEKICENQDDFSVDKIYLPLIKLYCNTRWDNIPILPKDTDF